MKDFKYVFLFEMDFYEFLDSLIFYTRI